MIDDSCYNLDWSKDTPEEPKTTGAEESDAAKVSSEQFIGSIQKFLDNILRSANQRENIYKSPGIKEEQCTLSKQDFGEDLECKPSKTGEPNRKLNGIRRMSEYTCLPS